MEKSLCYTCYFLILGHLTVWSCSVTILVKQQVSLFSEVAPQLGRDLWRGSPPSNKPSNCHYSLRLSNSRCMPCMHGFNQTLSLHLQWVGLARETTTLDKGTGKIRNKEWRNESARKFKAFNNRARCDDEKPGLQASCSTATFVALLRRG